jgi:uncharacterized membrane protein YuzA (DUF378 family)
VTSLPRGRGTSLAAANYLFDPVVCGTREPTMTRLQVTTLVLVVLGALNWGLMGLFQLDVVATLFAGPQSTLSRIIYILVGLAGLYQTVPLINALTGDADEGGDLRVPTAREPRKPAGRDRDG